jgi:hypothetical protein
MNQSDTGKQLAQKKLDAIIQRGKMDGMRLRETVKKTVIRPLKIYTKDMKFQLDDHKHKPLPRYFVTMSGEEHEFSLHSHAFSQMREEVDLSAKTVRVMLEGPPWDRINLECVLNTKFTNKVFNQRGGGPPCFINLVVGDQVRGFVGRGFKRHLRTGPLLDAFIMSCARFNALPVEAYATDLRINIRTILPHLFEPREGEFLALGMSLSNSDFGSGSFRIDLNVMDVRSGRVMPLKTLNGKNGRGEAHNGGGGDDDAVDSTELSEDTIKKKIIAKQGEVRDLVDATLKPDRVQAFFDEVADAMDKQISWYRFERYLRGKLNEEEMKEVQELLKKGAKSAELPDVQYNADDQAIMDLWFASNVIGHIANKASDERKEDLQVAAGRLLAG